MWPNPHETADLRIRSHLLKKYLTILREKLLCSIQYKNGWLAASDLFDIQSIMFDTQSIMFY